MWGLYDFLSRALLPTSSSIRSALFKNHSFAGESTVRRTPMRRSVSCGKEKSTACQRRHRTSAKQQKVRAGSIAQGTRGSISFTGRGRSSKRPCRFFRRRTDSTATEAPVSLVLDSRSTQSIFAYSSFRGELRPFHFVLTNLRIHATQRGPNPSAKNRITCGTTKRM